MRTTIRLDDELARELRALAGAEGLTFGKLVNRLLRRALQAGSVGKPRPKFKEKPARMGTPALDLSKALDLAGRLEDEETLRKVSLRK